MVLVPQLFSLLGVITLVVGQDIPLPAPPGSLGVTIRTSELIDHSRNESTPGAPTNQFRRLMVSMYSPTSQRAGHCQSPYILPKIAQVEHDYWAKQAEADERFSADYNRFKLQACSIDVIYGLPHGAINETEGGYPTGARYPVVMFSPGLGTSRFDYGVLSQWLAATGFFVMTVDHPYTSWAIQFPNGSFLESGRDSPSSWGFPETIEANEVRVADMHFLADQLQHNQTFRKLIFPPGSQPSTLDRFGIWGHSFGGATAAETVYEDSNRFSGGLDLDGQMFGNVTMKGTKNPFVLWNEAELNRTASPEWEGWWGDSTGFKRNIILADSVHLTFGDSKLLSDLYPFNKAAFGTLNGKRVIEILSAYARDFFRFTLEGKGPGLLQGPSKAYPEVTFYN